MRIISIAKGITVFLALQIGLLSFNQVLAIETFEDEKWIGITSNRYARVGQSVSIDGNTAMLGAPSDWKYFVLDPETDPREKPYNVGAVHAYWRSGTWGFQQKIYADDHPDLMTSFGWDVSLDGEWVLIGALNANDKGIQSGSAYLFSRLGINWFKRSKALASDGVAGDHFGQAVSLDIPYAVIGTRRSTGVATSIQGAAYVFITSGGILVERAKLTASDGYDHDYFGWDVSISGDTIVVGAQGAETHGVSSGAAYVFVRVGDDWIQEAKLVPSDAGDGAVRFGSSVSISGDTILVGDVQGYGNRLGSGAAWVFVRSAGVWTEQAKLIPSEIGHSGFGHKVTLDGNTALVTTYSGGDPTPSYIFSRNGDDWIEREKLIPSDGEYGDYFGSSASLDGGNAVVGSPTAGGPYSHRGAAYLFSLDPFVPPPDECLVVNPSPVDRYGNPVEHAPGISFTFENVEECGETRVVITEPGPGTPSAPSGLRITGPTDSQMLFDVTTTARLAAGSTFEVCIDYSSFEIIGDPSNLTLSHEVDSEWVDITSSNDTANMTICGIDDEFSYFAIIEAGSTVISCLAPNGGLMVDGQNFTVLSQGQSEAFQVQPEGSIVSLWSCGWDDGCKWLTYDVRAGSAWNIVTTEGARIVLERAAQESEPEFVLQWGSFGSATSEFTTPHGVEADRSGNIYVTERGNHRIQKFDAEGNYIQTIGSFGSGPGQFILPNEIAIDSNGDLYVSDEGNCRIQKLSSNGNFILQWGTCGGGPGQFALNWGIAIDSNDRVFVADTFNYRIQVFDTKGNYLREWGVHGVGNGEFEGPRGIAIDTKDNVIVADEGNHRIQKFENDGTYITQWGSFGSANGEFMWPHAAATDLMGNVYVGDAGNPWVQKFDKNGNFLVHWGSPAEFSGEQPGLDVSPTGLVYVSDINLSRIRVYGTSAEQVVEPWTGGEIETTDGQLSVQIPDNAISQSETILVKQSIPEDPIVNVKIGESSGSGEVLAAYDLQPDGLVFDNPVILTMTVEVTALNQSQRNALDIYLFTDTDSDGVPDTFVSLGANCNVSDGPVFIAICTTEIMHFSTYGLIAPTDSDQDGVADVLGAFEDQCPGTQIPESVPTSFLSKNRWALVNADTVFDTELAQNDASDDPYTVADTAGCSCEQIIQALDLGVGQTKFGCSSSVMKEWISSLSQ